MKALVVGGGGREHAIVRALRRSAHAPEVLCAPGNAGIAADAECLAIAADEVGAIVAAASERRVDLVVVGPEAALVVGLVDALEEAGVPAFGPSKAAAELEGSKAFAKELMREAGVPTAGYALLHSREQAVEELARAAYPTVLKADGLAAGKGVIICATEAEALAAAISSFAKAFDPSSSAAAWVGPKAGMPAASSASTAPTTSAASGPITARSTWRALASATIASMSSAATSGNTSASAAMPALPGAQRISGCASERASARTIACSRPPPPTTSAFNR